MTPNQMGVTKQQVQMQLDEFKRQVVVKQKLLEIQERRVAVCREAVARYDHDLFNTMWEGFGNFSATSFKRLADIVLWDVGCKKRLYEIDADQSQLMADNLREELGQLNNAVMEMTEIIHRMDSGIVLPRLEKTPRSNPGGN